ncbi:MAG: hypothetical protein GY821_05090 [Gammaproteobacteria bacterium]|nr:hypothetical protein [Gammaproteobacteria bacterium]
MKRLYTQLGDSHFSQNRQMLFYAGPRQVGKTTIGKSLQQIYHHFDYLNWDIGQDKKLIIAGDEAISTQLGLTKLTSEQRLVSVTNPLATTI